MKNQTAVKNRRELKTKMAIVFGERIQELPEEYREMLLDDLVTAFENRLKILDRPKSEAHFIVKIGEIAEYKAIQN